MLETAQRRRGGEDGFVLVSVIWLAGLIAVITAALAITARMETRMAANVVSNSRLEGIADGMTRLVAFRLAVDPAAVANGRCTWPGGTVVETTVQDQEGLIDLNTAPPDLLRRVVAAAGGTDAQVIVADIIDFRDADAVAQDGGQEPVLYPGEAYGPKNAPFQAAEELDQVPGIDDALYRRLLPLTTVYALQAGFDPAAMSQDLKALLNVRDDAKLGAYFTTSAKRVFAVDVVAYGKDGGRFWRRAIVAMARQPDLPFAVLEWQRGPGLGEDRPVPVAGAACFN